MISRVALLGLLLSAAGAWAGPPTLAGAYTGNLEAWHVRLDRANSNAFVAGFKSPQGFQVIAITNPAQPSYCGGFAFGQSAERLALSADGLRACLASYYGGLRILSLTNPAAPVELGTYNNGGSRARDVALSGDGLLAYVADESLGVEVISLINPALPQRIGLCTNSFGGGTIAAGVALNPAESLLLVAAEGGGLKVLDVANPALPVVVGQFPIPPGSGPMSAVTVSADGKRAYTAGGGGASEAGLHVLSITNPASPTLLARLTDPVRTGNLQDIVLASDESTAFLVGPNVGLRVVDVSLVTAAVYVAEFFESIDEVDPQATGLDLSTNDALAYVAEGGNGLRVVNVAGVYDIDNDGLRNGWELRYFGSLTAAQPGADSDGDGDNNLAEFVAGSDPRNSNSRFQMAVVTAVPFQVGVSSLVGRAYTLEYVPDLALPDDWQAASDSTQIPGTGGLLHLSDANTDSQRFYRVQVELAP